jgi:sigma-B regulation protein RsbU (phosphoserine phosphatase)
MLKPTRSRRMLCCFMRAAVGLVFLLSAMSLFAQGPASFSLDSDREQIVALDGLWRFHPGDDADGQQGWADPKFDDSAWPLLRSYTGWSTQGYRNMSGFGWYRFRILKPAGSKPLAIFFPRMFTSYQIFADGKLAGGYGGMPPKMRLLAGPAPVILLPQTGGSATTISIAIRVWHWPYWATYYGGGPFTVGYVGDAGLIEQQRQDLLYSMTWVRVPPMFAVLVCILGSLFALLFAVQHPREREYLWFGVWLLFTACFESIRVYQIFANLEIPFREVFTQSALAGADLALIGFYYCLLRGRRSWFFWVAIVFTLMRPLIHLLAMLGLVTNVATSTLTALLAMPAIFWILSIVSTRAMEGIPDARLLLAPALLQQGVFLAGVSSWMAFVLGFSHGSADFSNFFHLTVPPFVETIFLFAMLILLVRRFTRTRQQEERLTSELEAARAVQQVLIPEEIPEIPGFRIQSVYKPAGQVGGDFFQIVATESGGVLVVIGDVSGKGMPAAMTVSLLVGTFRTLALYTQCPGEMLSAMNQRMIGRNSGGFTTCLILRADDDGTVTVANAGHISPYVAGREIEVDNGLPLGLAATAAYTEKTFQLTGGEQLTLVTDGVVEARNQRGELFGFERTAGLANGSAESIAMAAQSFGQDDDITALTLSFAGKLATTT